MAGALPRYGTWVMLSPLAALSRTQESCTAEPAPAEPYFMLAWLALA